MAKSSDVLVKRVAVNGTRTHCRLIVIDGLRGIEEQRGYLLTVRHAQSHQCINACFRGERVRGGQLYLGFRHEQGVQLVHEGSHCAINYVSKDKQRAVLFAYDLHPRYKEPQHNVKLQGLDAGKTYTVKETNLMPGKQSELECDGKQYSGDYLMKVGLNIFTAQDGTSHVLTLE